MAGWSDGYSRIPEYCMCVKFEPCVAQNFWDWIGLLKSDYSYLIKYTLLLETLSSDQSNELKCLLTAILGDLQAKQFLYVHLPASGFKFYFRSPLGCIQMAYYKFYGPGENMNTF